MNLKRKNTTRSIKKVYVKSSKQLNGIIDLIKNTIDKISNNQQVKEFIDYSSDTVYRYSFITDKYEYMSPSISKLIGYKSVEVKKASLQKYINTINILGYEFSKIELNNLIRQKIVNNSSKWQADYLVNTKEGENIWINDTAYPWLNNEGEIIGIIGCLRDVTERVIAENNIKDELYNLASTDYLTGLYNRRSFFANLDLELKRLNRMKHPLSVMIIDIDNFKKINDTYGHDVGDRIIIMVAEKISSCLRETDVAARLGGEEFSLLLVNADEDGAYRVAQRILKSISTSYIKTDDGKEINCTVSIGISTTYSNDQTASYLYKEADIRLYLAKNMGRNQICTKDLTSNMIPSSINMNQDN